MDENRLPKEEMMNLLVNLNKVNLERKTHIKKYYKLRRLNSEVIDSMLKYITSSKYPLEDAINKIISLASKETKHSFKTLDINDDDDGNILAELLIYKNNSELQSITELYIEKNKLKSKSKIKMLEAMNNSYVGLFKVINTDYKEGYVTLEDVFTKKEFKIIDVSLSSSFRVKDNPTLYTYNRIITYDGLSFTTGIHCMTTENNKNIIKFISSNKYNNYSNFSRCMELYKICNQKKEINVVFNHNF